MPVLDKMCIIILPKEIIDIKEKIQNSCCIVKIDHAVECRTTPSNNSNLLLYTIYLLFISLP